MSKRLETRVVRAAPWAAAEAVSNAVTGFASVLVAGWFLAPADIGRAGIAISIVTLLGLISGFGIQESLVRHRSVHTSVTDTAFTGLVGIAVAAVAVCCLAAIPVGWLYSDPQVPSLLMAMSLLLLLNAAIAVPVAILTRKMRANVLTRRMMLARVAQVLGIAVLGHAGFGAWAMIGGMLLSNALSVAVLWAAMPRRPRFRFNAHEFRSLSSFGGSISLEMLLWQGTSRAFALMVGYFHGPAALGYFQFAQRLVEEAGNLIQGNIVRFGLSFFSDLERSSRDPSRVFLAATGLITAVGGPMFIGLLLVAPDLVPLAFGAKWTPAAPLVQIFAATWFFLLSRALAGPLLRAKGRQNALVLYAFAACVITLGSGLITAQMSLVAVTLGWASRNLVSLPWSYTLVARYGGITVTQQLRAVVRPLLPMVLMAVSVVATQILLEGSDAKLRLAASIAVGLIVAAVSMRLFNWDLIAPLRTILNRARGGRA
ncbi:oligosaccharide flippase family protein [Inquilinus limosus]|uniref:oligosaccharide flippase family protein n=1 Tax=Inquilinus limosus TaxID=171674 RepID=UPI0009DBCF2A|nr:oligosaccharide flippase family protein [Inquilinus limosus]